MTALAYISLKQNDVLDLTAGTAAAASMSIAIPRASTPLASDSADRLFLYVVNGDSADKTLTVLKGVSLAPTTRGGTANTDLAVTISHTAGGGIVGPLEVNRFAQADGSVSLTFSDVTSTTITAYMLPSRW